MANIKRANTSGITKSGVAIPDVPDAPTIGTATNVGTARAYNNGSATVAFTAAATGGTPTSYTATSTPGSFTASGAGSPLTVTGLQSATSYTFAVTATNASATGAASAASSSITATTVPQTPTIGTVTATNSTTVSVPFTGATGGSALTSATVTSSPSISLSTSGTSSPLTVTGTFVQGQAYSFTLTTTNANGTSSSSGSSNSVTPFAATAPAAPTIGTVSVTNSTTVSVPYTDGAANGSAITSRTITSSPSISLSYTNTSASPIAVTGSFVQGTAYTFSITTTNGVGTSSASSASNSITPSPLPSITGWAVGTNYPIAGAYLRGQETPNGSGDSAGWTIQGGASRVDIATEFSNSYAFTGTFSSNLTGASGNQLANIASDSSNNVQILGRLDANFTGLDTSYYSTFGGTYSSATGTPTTNVQGSGVVGWGSNTFSFISRASSYLNYYRTGTGAWTTGSVTSPWTASFAKGTFYNSKAYWYTSASAYYSTSPTSAYTATTGFASGFSGDQDSVTATKNCLWIFGAGNTGVNGPYTVYRFDGTTYVAQTSLSGIGSQWSGPALLAYSNKLSLVGGYSGTGFIGVNYHYQATLA